MKRTAAITLGSWVALVMGATTPVPAREVVYLPPAEITPLPGNPSTYFTVQAVGYVCDEECQELVDNSPIVTPNFGTTSVSATAPLIDPLGVLEQGPLNISDAASATLISTIHYSSDPSGLRSLSVTGTVRTVPFNGVISTLQTEFALTYKFEILGPEPTVQAQFLASGSVSSHGDALYPVVNSVEGGFAVFAPDGGALIEDRVCNDCEGPSSSFSESGMYTIDTGEIYTARLSASMFAEVFGNCDGGTLRAGPGS